MSGDMMGGGVVFAIAAALWIVYLLPSWMRRREYLATERTAVRLQQTLRILAETAEVPDEVRVEAKARAIAEHQRILRKAEEKALAQTRAVAAAEVRARRVAEAHAERVERERVAREALVDRITYQQTPAETAVTAATVPPVTGPMPAADSAPGRAGARGAASAEPVASGVRPPRVSRRVRLRRARAATSVTLLVGLIAAGVGAYLLVTAGSAVLLASGGFVSVCSILLIVRLAGEGRRLAGRAVASTVVVAHEGSRLYDHAEHETIAEAPPSWTPQPLPKPLHLSRGSIAAAAMASIDAASELRRAAADAAMEERAARIVRERVAVPLRPAAMAATARDSAVASQASPGQSEDGLAPFAADGGMSRSAGPSRFAAMGVVDGLGDDSIDLDEALRRRRRVAG